jgi:Nif-specific regulatory protein
MNFAQESHKNMQNIKPGMIIGSRYELGHFLGQGEKGKVYLAWDLHDGKMPVAIKILYARFLEAKNTASLREGLSLLSRLRHSNLTTVIDFGILSPNNIPFLVKEYVEGKDILRATEDWEPHAIIRQLPILCNALQYLHSRGIAHQSIKPSNIIFDTAVGAAGKLKLVDFGLADLVAGARQQFDLGILAYQAPEILLGQPANARSDFYSLGILIYQLLTRHLPFEDDDIGFLIQKHLQARADLTLIDRLGVGKGMSCLIASLLEKDPIKRPSSADEIIRLLQIACGESFSEIDWTSGESYFSTAGFVGREAEMNFLQGRCQNVRNNGRGSTIFLIGESGSGKTRLMQEFRIWALLAGWRVIDGRCQQISDKPYEPYRQILSRIRADVSLQSGESSLQDEAKIIESAPVPSESELFEPTSNSAAGQFRDSLTRKIVGYLSSQPTVLLLHDFHWADEAITAVLDYLSSDILPYPILICVCARTGDFERGPLGTLMDKCIRQERAEKMNLEPLSEEFVKKLIGSMTGEPSLGLAIGPLVYKSSGGNPFFVEEILKHLADVGLLIRDLRGWRTHEDLFKKIDVPASVAAVLRHRLSRLSEPARELASWLAVFNRPISPDLLSAINPGSSGFRFEALRELAWRHIVHSTVVGQGEKVEFCHAAISEVIRNDMKIGLRKQIHARIGEALEKSPEESGNVQEIAEHFMEAKFGDKAIRYALKAAAECKCEYANEKALKYLEYILRHKNNLSQEVLCQVAIDAADACCALGIPKQAIRILRHKRNAGMSKKSIIKGQILLHLAYSYKHADDFGNAEQSARQGILILGKSKSDQAVILKSHLWLQLSYCSLSESKPKASLLFLQKALKESPGQSPPALSVQIFNMTSLLYRVTCQLQMALIFIKKAISILQTNHIPQIASIAYSQYGVCLFALGRFSGALAQHRNAVEISMNARSLISKIQALANLAESLCRSGNFNQADITIEKAIEFAKESNNPNVSYSCFAIQAEVKICLGFYKDAVQILKNLKSEMRPHLAVVSKGYFYYLSSWLNTELGNFEAALQDLNELERLGTSDAPIYEAMLGEVMRARILFSRNQIESALALLRKIDQAATENKWPYHMCLTKLLLGDIFLNQRKLESARVMVKNGLRLANSMSSNHLKSKAYLLSGRVCLALSKGNGLHDCIRSGNCINPANLAHEEAFNKYNKALELSISTGALDLTWKIHLELAGLGKMRNDHNQMSIHATKALEAFEILKDRVPSEFMSGFMSAFGRDKGESICRNWIQINMDSDLFGLHVNHMEKEQLRILCRASSVINAIHDLGSLLEMISTLLLQATAMNRVMILLKQDQKFHLRLARAKDMNQNALLYKGMFVESIIDKVNIQGKPFLTANARTDSRLANIDADAFDQVGAILCAPLKISGQILGILYVDHPVSLGSLDESVINLFAAFCNMSAVAIDNAISHQRLVREKAELEHYLSSSQTAYPELVGVSSNIKSLRDRIALVAAAPLDVLICGESGTGKELVARAIHRTGRRAKGGFIALDCGALADSLVESELFGYRKGAFTGAIENRAGILEMAKGGIVFLDEISNLVPKLQAKLLRVLQEREVRRIGEAIARPIDVQIIAATNKDLREEIRRGRFRRDLFYRLNVMDIRISPLRKRLDDVPLLIQWFLDKIAKEEEGKTKEFSPDAVALLCQYSYPGNVRELRNIVQNCFYSCRERIIDITCLPGEVYEDHHYHFEANGVPAGGKATEIYSSICDGTGSFDDLVVEPLRHAQLGSAIVRQIIKLALQESRGKYRQAFRLLRIPEKNYHLMMAFLKRNECYVDFHPFRQKRGGK